MRSSARHQPVASPAPEAVHVSLQRIVLDEFRRHLGGQPWWVVRAPGRVNLIGEHTDYNEGFVLPMAIDRAIWLAVRPRPDRQVWLHSLGFNQTAEIDLNHLQHMDPAWGEYPRGVAWALQTAGHALQGWEGVMASDLPIGAGLSSSAALELAIARAFACVSNLPWDPSDMARLAQQADHGWVGIQSGIMDQLVSAAGEAGRALLIDCRNLAFEPVPLPPGAAVVILDTGTRRGLVDSAYNQRQAQCQTAAALLGVTALRDLSLETLAVGAHQLDPLTLRRARHVVSENTRTLEAVAAMRRGDAAELGELINASHASLRDDYEVSSPALEAMVSLAQGADGCYGSRLTGAGFGGCALALVTDAAVSQFMAWLDPAYREATGLEPSIYQVTPSEGVQVITLDG